MFKKIEKVMIYIQAVLGVLLSISGAIQCTLVFPIAYGLRETKPDLFILGAGLPVMYAAMIGLMFHIVRREIYRFNKEYNDNSNV